MSPTPLRLALCLFVVGSLPHPAPASEPTTPPEALLAKDSVVYLRFDGLHAHGDAYEQTILAELLANEFGPLIDDLKSRALNALGPQLWGEELLSGAQPDQLLKLQAAHKELPHLLEYFMQRGFVVGAEVISPMPPRFQVTIVFPEGGKPEHRTALFGGVRLIGLMSKTRVEEVTRDDRTFLKFDVPDEQVKVLCWQQGDHMLLTIGTEDVDHTLRLAAGERENLTANAVYQRLAEFDGYPTVKRGFLDVEHAATIAEKAFPPAGMLLEKLGLRGLKQFAFHAGFEDRMIRTTFEMHMPGERTGLLQLLTAEEPLDREGLPNFPPDANSVTVSRFHLGTFYASVIDAIEVGLGMFQPNQLQEFQQGLKQAQDALGIDLEQDLFDALGSTLAVYSAPSEGPINMGTTIVMEVKDREKLTATLKTLINTLPATTGADIGLREHDYNGTPVYTLNVTQQGFPFAPTYAITDDGWLVIGFFPQPVHGFLYRNSGKKTAVWQEPAMAQQALKKVGAQTDAKITAVSVVDPRPGLEEVLSLAPILVKFISSFSGAGTDFNIGLIPPAQPATERLTHNVTVVVDDGKTVRWEGYASLPLPLQLTGLDMYGYLAFFSFARFAF